jgi:very-short-patch-repair endonuclease
MSPAEVKLWQHLCAHRMGNVHFRNQHAIGAHIVDFCAPRKKLIVELDGPPFGRSTSNRKIMMPREQHFSSPKAIVFCASGTMTC